MKNLRGNEELEIQFHLFAVKTSVKCVTHASSVLLSSFQF